MKRFLFLFIFVLSITCSAKELSVGITTSGGVSLGTYEAGFHYYLSEYSKLNKSRIERFKGFNYYTGASAGAANSVMSIFSSCNPEAIPIEESPFWKFWTRMSTSELLRPEDTTSISLLSPNYVLDEMYPEYRRIWKNGFPKDCDVILGIAVTRLVPEYIEWEGTVEVPRLAEHFIFKIKGRGIGKAPTIENYILPNYKNYQILYPFTNNHVQNFEGVLDILQASTAFPLAFPPVSLEYCFIDKARKCDSSNKVSAKFIDGGMFDNIPLNLLKLIQDDNEKKKFGNKRTKVLFYVSPYSVAFMKDKKKVIDTKSGYDAQDHVTKVFNNFIDSARKRELRAYTHSSKDLLVPSVRYFPLASSPMYAFFGFLEKDFRLYDFYLGMVDARKLIVRHLRISGDKGVSFPEDNEFKNNRWTPFYCIAAYLSDDKYRDHCLSKMKDDEEGMYNFKVLFKVSLVKLFNKCEKKKSSLEHPVCDSFKNDKNALSEALNSNYSEDLNQSDEESDTQYTLRLLQHFKFQFKDLGIPVEKNEFAPHLIQKKFNKVVTSFTGKQKFGNQTKINFAATNALSTLAIQQFDSTYYFEVGSGIEVGYTNTLSLDKYSTGFTKYNLSLLSFSTDNYFSNSNRAISVSPMIGVQQAIYGWSTTNVFHNLGLNVGYQLSNGDHYGRESCDTERFNGDASACSGLNLQSNYLLVLFQRLRVKFYGNYIVNDEVDNKFSMGFHVGINLLGKY